MYCHSLTATKGKERHLIPCEDSPLGESLVCIWLYELPLDEKTYEGLLHGLVEWARTIGLKTRLYTSRNSYETTEPEQ